jgi:cytochrome c-type biogenesis protein CcmH
MRQALWLAAAWLVMLAAHGAELQQPFADPALEQRYRALIREIRCPKCLNESIADSAAPVAGDLRREVHRLIAEGKSDDEVKDFLSARYGDFVLYRPRISSTTWALWSGPAVLLLLGSFVFWRILRTRRAQPLDDDEAPLT